MKIVYFTSGLSGMGRIVLGAAVEQAFKRKDPTHSFTVISSSEHGRLLKGIDHVRIPLENEAELTRERFGGSVLYQTLTGLKPDILIADHLWFPLFHMIGALSCKKIFIATQKPESFYTIKLKNETLRFDREQYDRVIAVEPAPFAVTGERVDPLIIRNADEILSREEAERRLGLAPGKKHCLFSLNLEEKAFRDAAKSFAYLEEEGFDIFYSSLFAGGIFPIVDYFNAFDFIVCGGGYNAFWETVFFKKESHHLPVSTKFEDQPWRIGHCRDYEFRRNGADELAEIILNL